ncbi:hypothetical protein LS72_008805 [Helicobacter apodemus]|uniref:YopX protein domain-containing protein n=1 Tax=Helicobacter apodemus TaxID=135569 RepID=A0A4U8UDA1_9HELI|nr:YopX family protein [Helicobacter apodemus]TLE14491.1 hypothetical protein LS72_008805 [Helicobacter apodemus]
MKLQDLDFRVWDISKKIYYNNLEFSMMPGDKNTFSINLGIVFAKNLESASMLSSNYEVELYTGLKDKSGNKIYEGDIIAHCVDGGGVEYYSKIEFNHKRGMFEFVCIEHPVIETFDKLANPDIEVVGNIRENKDLLEL